MLVEKSHVKLHCNDFSKINLIVASAITLTGKLSSDMSVSINVYLCYFCVRIYICMYNWQQVKGYIN